MNSNEKESQAGQPNPNEQSLTSSTPSSNESDVPILNLIRQTGSLLTDMTTSELQAFAEKVRSLRASPPTLSAALRAEGERTRKLTADVKRKVEVSDIVGKLLQ